MAPKDPRRAGDAVRLGRVALAGLVLAASVLPVRSAAAQEPLWSPRVAVVWPHDGQGNPTPPHGSRAVNVSVWPANRVACDSDPRGTSPASSQFELRVAKNNESIRRIGVPGQLVMRTVGGARFPTVEYQNVPADLVAEPDARYRFLVGLPGLSNIWVHAADARTLLPRPVVPTGYAGAEAVPEARVQVVWPHDERGAVAPVERATLVNVAVDVFAAGTTLSFPPEYQPEGVRLFVAIGNGQPRSRFHLAPEEWVRRLPEPEKTTYEAGERTYPRWVFNDVPVTPGQQYHFLGFVFDGKIAYYGSNVWTHAADARTLLPHPEPPPACVP